MHILANLRSKNCIKCRLIISSKFVTIWVVTRGGGGSDTIVTMCKKRSSQTVMSPQKYRFNNRIRVTLKFVITPLPLLFNVAFSADNPV